MTILVYANDLAWSELVLDDSEINWIRAENAGSFRNRNDVDGYINLSDEASENDFSSFKKPVFINSVSVTLQKMNAPGNVYRINGWNGFIKRNSWEVAGVPTDEAELILKALKKNIIRVPDEPGFIAASIIAMIINEAYFAKAEKVSTEKEIDIAMKLGTNYPFGPFEWAAMIGVKNIFTLLKTLSTTDKRYYPSALLEKEANKYL
jgi:3-hydroxybutyryl-CoA dehydrogenase